jgi:Mrp family chromosome partitioning ATPase
VPGSSLPDERNPEAVEAYDRLVNSLRIPDFHVQGRSIVVTGADAGPNKSIVALNLATLLARGGSKVVLVEADLRLAKRRRIGDGTPSSGLAGLLVNGMRPTSSALVHTLDPKLKLLPVGSVTGTASTLIRSPRLPLVADSLRSLCDYVIYDAPPVLEWQEMLMLSRRADVTLLVIDAGKTQVSATKRAAAALQGVNAGSLGLVLDRAAAWVTAPQAKPEAAAVARPAVSATPGSALTEGKPVAPATPQLRAELALEELLANLEAARRMVSAIPSAKASLAPSERGDAERASQDN